MSDPISNWEAFLRELYQPAAARLDPSLLLEMFKREDDAYLASLSELKRRRVLLQRRLARYRNWWTERVAWRFASRRPDEGEW